MTPDSNQKTPERHQLWVEIYERELAKPHFVCLDPKIERETHHRHAADRADIELLYMKDAI